MITPDRRNLLRREACREMKRDPLSFLNRCADEQGPLARLALDRDSFLLNDPADIRQVLVADRLNYVKEPHGVAWFRPIFGRSLPFLEGSRHREVRSALQTTFSPSGLDALPATIAGHTARLTAAWADGQALDVAEQMRRITFGVASTIILGLPAPDAAERMYAAIQAVHRRIVAQMPGPVTWPRRRPPFTRARRRQRRAARALDAIVHELIAQRRAVSIDGPDVLATLLRAQASGQPALEDEELRDHCVNLVLASTDPVAYTAAWALYFCGDNRDTHDTVAEEARRVIGDRTDLTRQDVGQLTWTRQVVEEALRLRPLTWMFEREPLADATLPSGQVIPAGARVMISPYVLHRRESLFDAPAAFDPHHFDAAAVRARSPYAFLPFGAGPRACLGQPMAMMTATVMVALAARDYVFERVEGAAIRHMTVNGFTLQPPEGKFVMRCRRLHRG